MAYRARRRTARGSSRGSYSGGRRRSAGVRRAAAPRRAAGGGRTIRIVVEQAQPSIPRLPVGMTEAAGPRKAKF